MHKLYELKDKLMDELEAYSENGKYSKDDVEAIKYMASAVDHLCNILAEDGESYAMMPRDGRSYARGTNARRDSRGRYSRRYSRDGYSYGDDTVNDLREIMQDAPEHMKGEIRKVISKIESM